MNSKNLNDERELDAWLTRALHNRSDYIEDAGFTESVIQRLPARPARRWVALLWVLLAAAFAGALALLLIPAQALAYALVTHLLAVSLTTLIQAGVLASAALVVGVGCWIWQEG